MLELKRIPGTKKQIGQPMNPPEPSNRCGSVPRLPDAAAGRREAATDGVFRALERKAAARHVRQSSSSPQGLASVLDHEIDRLPPRVKAPLVYCELGGRRIEEAARLLGWSPRRVRRRLRRGRQHLRTRLWRQGIRISTARLTQVLRQHASAAERSEHALAQTVQLATGNTGNWAGLSSRLARLVEQTLDLLGF